MAPDKEILVNAFPEFNLAAKGPRMLLTEANRLLDPGPLPLETGWERLPDGSIHVACRTDLHGCTGEMFSWWFRSRPDTDRYRWWHPIDHVYSKWQGTLSDESHVGSEHVVTERLTELSPADLVIQFRDNAEFFDTDALSAARSDGRVSTLVAGRVGLTHEPTRQDDGTVLGGRLIHLGRDTAWGVALRSHFFLGTDEALGGAPADAVKEMFPDVFGPNLLEHCYDEFTFLSRILPALYAAESGITPPRPW